MQAKVNSSRRTNSQHHQLITGFSLPTIGQETVGPRYFLLFLFLCFMNKGSLKFRKGWIDGIECNPLDYYEY